LLKGERDAVGRGLRDVACLRKIGSMNGASEGSLAILCSCDEGQQAREIPQCRQGLFSLSLLQILTDSLSASQEVAVSDVLENALAARMEAIAAQHGFTLRQRPWIQRSGRPAVLITGTSSLTVLAGAAILNRPAGQPLQEVPTQTQQRPQTSEMRLGGRPDSQAEKTLAEAKQLILDGNAREARSRLRRYQELAVEPNVQAGVFLGISMLCERDIGAMLETDIRKAESLLACGLKSNDVARLAAYGLAAIRHCFYRDHSMKEPTPTFNELKRIYESADELEDDMQSVLKQLKVCEEFGADWLLA